MCVEVKAREVSVVTEAGEVGVRPLGVVFRKMQGRATQHGTLRMERHRLCRGGGFSYDEQRQKTRCEGAS